MSTIQVESLWRYIQTLSLSKKNRRWLAERLLENDSVKDEVNETTKKAMGEVKEGKVTSFSSLEDFKNHIYEL